MMPRKKLTAVLGSPVRMVVLKRKCSRRWMGGGLRQTIRKVAKDPFLKAMVACDGEALKRIIDGRGHGRKDEVGKGEDEGEWLVRGDEDKCRRVAA